MMDEAQRAMIREIAGEIMKPMLDAAETRFLAAIKVAIRIHHAECVGARVGKASVAMAVLLSNVLVGVVVYALTRGLS